ncbi:MAG: helix-hairpin-helix domain-containing protein [Candidatus Cloacimonetes bacterium]|nr:helix-hairpin-helix domain-containing protein [Candidatus Cloacimonadota bacterium]
MKWMRKMLTPDERKVLLFLAAALLLGSLLHLSGVYASQVGDDELDVASDLSDDVLLVYDLRTATREELLTVPGIGPVTADRILAWRERRTPERRSDLLEVHGIGPQTFQRLAPYFHPLADDDTLRAPLSHEIDQPLDINRADEHLLATLRGIGPVLAAGIVAWRDSVGPFSSPEDLARVPGIGEQTVDKLRPYITTGVTP